MPYVAPAPFGVLGTSATVQVLVQSRSAGVSRFRRFGDGRFSAEWWSGCLLLVGFGCAALGPDAHLLGCAAPVAVLDRTWVQVLGIVVWCVAAVGLGASQVVLGASWRVGVVPEERRALILQGPFRVVRHPMYTGLSVLLVAPAMVDPTWVALSAAPLALSGWEVLVRYLEEPHLMATHPEYARYRARVGRFLPMIGRVAPGPPTRAGLALPGVP